MKLHVAGIVRESIVDGPGIRYVVFVQGCPHHCPGCHNPQALPFEGGTEMDAEEIFAQFQQDPILKGITFSGGEPFCQPEPLVRLAELVRSAGKTVAAYTGYTYEALLDLPDPAVKDLLARVDLLIDGPFVQAERNLELSFRGSENQRLIDMEKTRAAGKVVLWQD